MRCIRSLTVVLLLLAAAMPLAAQNKRPVRVDDLFLMKRISDPAVSPDGRLIVFTVSTPDLQANKNFSDLWSIQTDGYALHRLTDHPAADGGAAWSPDGKWIVFESTRSGTSQIWAMTPDGKDVRQLTTISTGASQPLVSPDGKWLAFISEVFPEYSDRPFQESDSLNKIHVDEQEHGKVKAQIFSHLLYRHWDHWVEGKRQHLFVQPFPAGQPRDLTPGDRDAVPTSMTFSAGKDFAFSPDSKEIAYTATPVPVHEEAWSTNHDIYIVQIDGGQRRQLTTNPAADGYPQYSPDGRYIAYRAQKRAGYEADRWELMLYDRKAGTTRSLTASFDASVGTPTWAPDSKTLYFDAEIEANDPVLAVTIKGNDIRKVITDAWNHYLSVSADGKQLFFARASAVRPAELFRAGTDGKDLRPVTGVNDSLFATLDIPAPRAFWYTGAGGTRVHSWLFTPPAFSTSQKYPLIMMVHGGPQGSWGNSWSYRWNPALWAAQGYLVIAPNPRGSTGFGQHFVDEISGDWGGKVFVDLMRGLDTVCTLSYVDSTRKGAAGASFGGYMMNWFLGHTGNRFKAIVTHDGVYNFESMYGSTDEVWFDEWEHGGAPWQKPQEYARFSPHRYAANFKTPTLIVHGAFDFRIPATEAMQLFTALQRQGVPSKFLYFPDETHWVLKPANSMLWHRTVFDWLDSYVKQGAGSR